MNDALWTLKQTAEFFQLSKDTIVKYGKEGRIRIVGSGNGQRVVRSSIEAYMECRSEWHKRRGEYCAPPAPSTYTSDFKADRKLRRGQESTPPVVAAQPGRINILRTDRKLRRG